MSVNEMVPIGDVIRKVLDDKRAIVAVAAVQFVDKGIRALDGIVIRPHPGTSGFMRRGGQVGQG